MSTTIFLEGGVNCVVHEDKEKVKKRYKDADILGNPTCLLRFDKPVITYVVAAKVVAIVDTTNRTDR